MSSKSNVFTRNAAGLNLTPAERAFIKALQGLLITFIAAALPIAVPAVQSWLGGASVAVDWRGVLDNAIKAGLVAVAFVGMKYITALKDAANGIQAAAALPEPASASVPVFSFNTGSNNTTASVHAMLTTYQQVAGTPVPALPEGHTVVEDTETHQLYAAPLSAFPGQAGENGTNEPHIAEKSVNLVTPSQNSSATPTEGEPENSTVQPASSDDARLSG